MTEYLNEREAARDLKFSTVTLQRMRLTGEGPRFAKLGKKSVRYRRADLDEWVESRLVRSTSEVLP